jgi:hypothetical protein
MNVTKLKVVTVVGFIMSSLLVLTANCSFEKKTSDDSALKQMKKQSSQKKETFVANSFCAACHYGFGNEELARTHERAGIGCERCHGESERHRSDEDNITPPEIMYPKERINPTCMMCHPRTEIKHVTQHKPILAGAETIFDKSSKQKICTDCHGTDHRIKVRTIRWNKATGELLEK